jgi:hypothetical protein
VAIAAASGTLLDRIARMAGEPRGVLGVAGGVVAVAAARAIAAPLFVATLNIPSPTMPAGVRLRRPLPAAGPSLPGGLPGAVPKRQRPLS